MYTLERSDIDLVELFLVIKDSNLFATAVCLKQELRRTKKLGPLAALSCSNTFD